MSGVPQLTRAPSTSNLNPQQTTNPVIQPCGINGRNVQQIVYSETSNVHDTLGMDLQTSPLSERSWMLESDSDLDLGRVPDLDSDATFYTDSDSIFDSDSDSHMAFNSDSASMEITNQWDL